MSTSSAEHATLTADERGKLHEQIRRAQQFEQQEDIDLMRQPLEGILLKFTNAFQGYQARWFVLDPTRAELSYYLKEEHRHSKRPRGILNLNGASITPSEEDSLAFTVAPAIGEPTYRLRAADTKQKTEWINRMRTASEEQSQKRLRDALRENVKTPAVAEPVRHGVAREAAVLHNVYKILSAMSDQLQVLNRNIDGLPESDINGRLDPNVLTLKALAQAAFGSMEHSWSALNDMQNSGISSVVFSGHHIGSSHRNSTRGSDIQKSPSLSSANSYRNSLRSGKHNFQGQYLTVGGAEGKRILSSDYSEETEVESGPPFMESDLGSVESQKAMILTMLSGLALGTDLTRVPLPTFILQSRSTLEMFSDFFANVPYFVKIADPNLANKTEERLAAIVKWFLTAFHFGCKGALPRKPYNPALGEIFRCTWESSCGESESKVRFVAEQVSHHPPVTAFFASCKEKGIFLNGCVSPKSKYMGTSLSATMAGQVRLVVMGPGEHVESYRITLPTCFARSILTTPWIELGGKCTIACVQNPDVFATVTFQTKPFYGGKVHRVAGEVKSNGGTHVFCRFQGEWNRQLEFIYETRQQTSGADANDNYYAETLDVANIDWASRHMRPLEKQDPRESRRLWRSVTEALRRSDFDIASQEKQRIEQAQRGEYNGETNQYSPIFFEKSSCDQSTAGPGALEGFSWVHPEMPRVE